MEKRRLPEAANRKRRETEGVREVRGWERGEGRGERKPSLLQIKKFLVEGQYESGTISKMMRQ